MTTAVAQLTDGEIALRGRVWPGPPDRTFVLLHGLGVGSRLVAPLAVRLRHLGRVVAPDLPGIGASADLAPHADAVGIGPHADVLHAWLRSRDLREVVLVGVSVGTQVALRVAAAAPRRVAQLVLLSPTVDPSHRSVPSLLARLPLEQAPNSLAFHRITLQDQAAAGPRRLWHQLRSAVADEPEALLPDVSQPTLVVRGTLDPLVSRGWAEDVADGLPAGRFLELRGGRHALSFEEADTVAAAIDEHLQHTVTSTTTEQPA